MSSTTPPTHSGLLQFGLKGKKNWLRPSPLPPLSLTIYALYELDGERERESANQQCFCT